MPNYDQALNLIRQALLIGGTYLVTRGMMSEQTMLTIVAALATLIGSVWSVWARSTTSMINSVAAMPVVSEVKVSTVSQANAGPSNVVVGFPTPESKKKK